MSGGNDPGSLQYAFLSGQQLTSDQIDVDNDLIPYFKSNGDGTYIMCVVSPADLYTAMSA